MATIKATCNVNPESSHDIEIHSQDLKIIEWDGGKNYAFRFKCQECLKIDYHPTSVCTAQILEAAGVRIESVESPIHEIGTGEPITHDDLLDFHEELKNKFLII